MGLVRRLRESAPIHPDREAPDHPGALSRQLGKPQVATMTNTRTWTVLELINWSKGHLEEKGFDNARLEVELLLSHALKLPRVELYVQFERQLNAGELAAFKALYKRRLEGEPVQYITGTAAFMLGEFEVNPAVLIPRPETEALTEVVLRMLGEWASVPAAASRWISPGATGNSSRPG